MGYPLHRFIEPDYLQRFGIRKSWRHGMEDNATTVSWKAITSGKLHAKPAAQLVP